MPSITDEYPEYSRTGKLDTLRATEYGYLDEQDHVYLDYTGAGLAARSQLQAHRNRLDGATFGNPHSENPTSRAATDLVDRARRRVLLHLNASPEDYHVIFTPNATGAAKLVGEAYPFARGARLVLTADNHNSLNGLREYARRAGSKTRYVPLRPKDLRIDTEAPSPPRPSNFSGVRHPLRWIKLAQDAGYDVLLDAAAYLPTSQLDLSTVNPSFVIVSWYKVFGFPTGVGCLVARRDALARLARPYFAGGTVQAATVAVPWHALAPAEAAFEDGTLNYLSIPDVHAGLDWVSAIGMDTIATRVRCLTGLFIDRLLGLRHGDGSPMAVLYGPAGTESRGGTVAFNLLDARGRLVDERLVAQESGRAHISLRTGCFCNPGAGEAVFGIAASTLRPLVSQKGGGTFDDFLRMAHLPTGGAIRVSFGVASTCGDVDYFMDFATKTYKDRVTSAEGLAPRPGC
ncbi:Ribonuclease H-like protein [Metarhizium robertsii ARSEF 23]|uniref:Ribonuclease H-like protein n=1 Tax=Metarhizium robertsii (strain ARSEF 23 / ATCC MYA-3075) TaxID=655844 RepID=A0A0B2XHF1_METRA|nr:Ribonuclease H-like protein [Metarhizium robertsii ARSEF 23]KHO11414.1 Ribonuclease H-like protein [Metarhizium robertsii ARSEF 23]